MDPETAAKYAELAKQYAELAQDVKVSRYGVENLWLFLSAVLVLIMQPGFAFLETGLVPARNTVNVLFKNFIDWCVSLMAFLFIGYSIMFGESLWGLFGSIAFMWPFTSGSVAYSTSLVPSIHFLYEFAFAATTATIISGAVTGRIRHSAYLWSALLLAGVIFPVVGHWVWHKDGWLCKAGFQDFAGSTVVHTLGGIFALIGAAYLGPRMGQFRHGFADIDAHPYLTAEQKEEKKANLLNGLRAHNLPLTTLGVFLLWVGWYGFNPGSVFSDPNSTLTLKGKIDLAGTVALNTTIAAGFGALSVLLLEYFRFKWKEDSSQFVSDFGRPRLSVIVNGSLGGLVGITANCNSVTPGAAIVIGFVSGLIVVSATWAVCKAGIDDVVNVFPVHGACGIWGGLACAIFGSAKGWPQIKGLFTIIVLSAAAAVIFFGFLKRRGWLRIPPEEEEAGVDFSLHRQHGYTFVEKKD